MSDFLKGSLFLAAVFALGLLFGCAVARADDAACQLTFEQYAAEPVGSGDREVAVKGQDAIDFKEAASRIGAGPPESIDEFYLVFKSDAPVVLVAFGRDGCIKGNQPMSLQYIEAILQGMKEIKTKREGTAL